MKDATSMLFCGLVTEGIVCTDERSPIPKRFNLCSVDYVAAAIVAIATLLPWEQHEAEFAGAAFHLCARESVSLAVVCDWLRVAGYAIENSTGRTVRILKHERWRAPSGREHERWHMQPLGRGWIDSRMMHPDLLTPCAPPRRAQP